MNIRRSWPQRWSAGIGAGLAALVLLVCAAALWFVDRAGERLILRQERETIARELDYLVQLHADQGFESLEHAIARRARLDEQNRLYALRTADGAVAAGNIGWPAGLNGGEDWRLVHSDGRPVYVATRTLPDGAIVLAGHDDASLKQFQGEVFDAALIAIAIVAVACLLLAILTTNYLLRRVRRLSLAAQRFAAGDLAARVNIADHDGPFAEIARAQNAMLDRIETLMVGLRTVTDSLAHDLRTPLARTRQGIEQALSDSDENAKQAALETALSELDSTVATFASLIDIARADAGLSQEAMAELELAPLVQDIYELFQPLAADRGQRLVVATSPARIIGHRPLLMQAISNLVHNAIKYGPEGGEIALTLKGEGNGVSIEVSDHGPGIPQAASADAVKRFKRLSADGDAEGLGLGLAIADASARLHGGALVLEDNKPGLRARIMLPAKA